MYRNYRDYCNYLSLRVVTFVADTICLDLYRRKIEINRQLRTITSYSKVSAINRLVPLQSLVITTRYIIDM